MVAGFNFNTLKTVHIDCLWQYHQLFSASLSPLLPLNLNKHSPELSPVTIVILITTFTTVHKQLRCFLSSINAMHSDV